MLLTIPDCGLFFSSAANFLEVVDPDGILSAMRVDSVSVVRENGYSYVMSVMSPVQGGNCLKVFCDVEGVILRIHWGPDSNLQDLSIVPSARTVAEALGNLSELPDDLKAVLVPVGMDGVVPKVKFTPAAIVERSLSYLSDGLKEAWGGFFDSDGTLSLFYRYSRGTVSSVMISFARTFVSDGRSMRVKVSRLIDVFGFHDREVKVDFLLSDMGFRGTKCVGPDGKTMSLQAAKILYDIVFGLNPFERRESERPGVPRGIV